MSPRKGLVHFHRGTTPITEQYGFVLSPLYLVLTPFAFRAFFQCVVFNPMPTANLSETTSPNRGRIPTHALAQTSRPVDRCYLIFWISGE